MVARLNHQNPPLFVQYASLTPLQLVSITFSLLRRSLPSAARRVERNMVDSLAPGSSPEPLPASLQRLHLAVTIVQYAYPIFILCFFIFAFTLRSILASIHDSNVHQPTQTGPGGKPLPATDPTRNFVKKKVNDDVTQSQKRVFEWLSLITALSFLGNAGIVVTHALAERDKEWWCGKQVVVSNRAGATVLKTPLTCSCDTRSTSSAPSSYTVSSSSRSSTRSRPPR
jgi:hypothetical protein